MEIEPVKNDVGMSWEMVKLVDICDFQGGTQPPKSEWSTEEKKGFVRMIQIRDFTQGKDRFVEYVKDSRRLKKCKSTDIMIGRYGASIGKILTGLDGAYNVALVKTIPSDKLDKNYFYHYLNTPYFQNFIQNAGSRAAQAGFNKEELKDLQIPLPPLPIQRRIAEILDAADALKRKDQQLLKKYDELAQAIFIDMFGDPVKNEKGFKLARLGDCLENIQIGPFGTQLHESDYIKNGIPVINPMHIGDLKIKPNYNYSITEKKYLELPQYHLKVDDVILARRGEMGRCAIVTEHEGKCLCGTGSLYLTVNKNLLNPLFLVYVLSRKTTKIALENVSAGTTMANLNKNIINDFKIIIPDIKRQKDFVKAIRLSEKSIEYTMKSIGKSEYLFNSLLQKAFKGELV